MESCCCMRCSRRAKIWAHSKLWIKFVVFTLLLSWVSLPTDGLRILAIFPFNSRSHFSISDSLMKGLAEKGHQVDFYSHFTPGESVSNLKHYSLAGSLHDLTNNMTYEETTQIKVGDIQYTMDNAGKIVCKLMDLPVFQNLLKNPPENPSYDLVIVEVFLSNCYLAWGRFFNTPIIGMSSNVPMSWHHESLGNPFNTAVTPVLGFKNLDRASFWDRFFNTLLTKYINTLITYYMYEQDEYVEKYFGPGYPDVIALQKDLDLMLINTHLSLNEPVAYTPAIIEVAGLHIKDDDSKLQEDVQKWLDDSKDGCVYVSFGSMVKIETFPKHVMESFYASFRKISPIRVLMKISKPEELIAGLPENVMTKSWLPQEQIFKHKNTKLFVTHGGLMSGQESIYYGVPMIGIPMFGDQQINVEANVKRGISAMITIKDITEKKLSATFNEVLRNPQYKKNIERLSKRFTDRPRKPLEEAVYWVEYVARYGKGCLKSPLVDMPWYQVNLIDVYGFIVLVLTVSLFVLGMIIKSLGESIFSNKTETESLKKNR